MRSPPSRAFHCRQELPNCNSMRRVHCLPPPDLPMPHDANCTISQPCNTPSFDQNIAINIGLRCSWSRHFLTQNTCCLAAAIPGRQNQGAPVQKRRPELFKPLPLVDVTAAPGAPLSSKAAAGQQASKQTPPPQTAKGKQIVPPTPRPHLTIKRCFSPTSRLCQSLPARLTVSARDVSNTPVKRKLPCEAAPGPEKRRHEAGKTELIALQPVELKADTTLLGEPYASCTVSTTGTAKTDDPCAKREEGGAGIQAVVDSAEMPAADESSTPLQSGKSCEPS